MSSCALLASRRKWWRRTLITQNYGHCKTPKHFFVLFFFCLDDNDVFAFQIFRASAFIVSVCFSWCETDGLTLEDLIGIDGPHDSQRSDVNTSRGLRRKCSSKRCSRWFMNTENWLIEATFHLEPNQVWSLLMSIGDRFNKNWVNPFNSFSLWLCEIDFVLLLVWWSDKRESRVERTKRSQAAAAPNEFPFINFVRIMNWELR